MSKSKAEKARRRAAAARASTQQKPEPGTCWRVKECPTAHVRIERAGVASECGTLLHYRAHGPKSGGRPIGEFGVEEVGRFLELCEPCSEHPPREPKQPRACRAAAARASAAQHPAAAQANGTAVFTTPSYGTVLTGLTGRVHSAWCDGCRQSPTMSVQRAEELWDQPHEGCPVGGGVWRLLVEVAPVHLAHCAVPHGVWCLGVPEVLTGSMQACAACAPEAKEVGTLRDVLLVVDRDVPPAVLVAWTEEERKQAMKWAARVHASASDNPVRVPPEPEHVRAYASTTDQRTLLEQVRGGLEAAKRRGWEVSLKPNDSGHVSASHNNYGYAGAVSPQALLEEIQHAEGAQQPVAGSLRAPREQAGHVVREAPNTSPCEERSAPEPPEARLLAAAVLMRRAASHAGEVARLIAVAQEHIQEAERELTAHTLEDWSPVRTGCDLCKLEAQRAATRLPTLADAVARRAMPKDNEPESGAQPSEGMPHGN